MPLEVGDPVMVIRDGLEQGFLVTGFGRDYRGSGDTFALWRFLGLELSQAAEADY
jgi:hypothetical protein